MLASPRIADYAATAVDAILRHLDAVRAEIANWEKTARNIRLVG